MTTEYILQNTEQAATRLRLQHQLYKNSSESLLLEAGIQPDMKVLEVGCGIGLMTDWLLEQIRDPGHLTTLVQ